MATRKGTKGKDKLKGTNGDDTILGKGGNDKLHGKDGDDHIKGGGGNDKIYGDAGDDDLFGGGGNDKMFGDIGSDFLDGGKGNDKLDGGGDNDELVGGLGNDELTGGDGNDELYGGDGSDSFMFGGFTSGRDNIWDFNLATDKIFIDLDAYGFSSVDELFDTSDAETTYVKSDGGDSWIMLNRADNGDDTHQIFIKGVDNYNDLKARVFDIDL
jgi:Ca2+-binding RTX toxin-like protein